MNARVVGNFGSDGCVYGTDCGEFHECTLTSKLIKLYISNMYSFFVPIIKNLLKISNKTKLLPKAFQ